MGATRRGYKGTGTDAAFFLLLAAVLCFYLWLAPYGWAGSDEADYLAEPYRMAQGDCFFVDNWDCGQLYGFVMLPLMRLYLRIAPGADGIFLHFRLLYALFSCLVAALIYLRGRRISRPAALVAALMLALYAPLSIRTFSYNAMGLYAMLCMCMTVCTAREHPFRDHVFAGVCLAALVLCFPFTVSLYLLWVLAVLVFALREKRGGQRAPYYALTPRALLAVTLGVGILFVLFCVHVLSRAGLREVIAAFPNVFRDPEHQLESVFWLAKNVVYCVIVSAPGSERTLILCGALAAVVLLDRGRLKRRALYLSAAAVLCAVYAAPFAFSNLSNELMLPLSILGVFAYILAERRQKELFFLLFVPGLIYAVCMHHSSSLRYLALCHGFAVCSTASVFFLFHVLDELLREKRGLPQAAVCALVALVLVAQLGLELHSRLTVFFHDEGFAALDTRIEEGVQKGLVTSAPHAAEYRTLLRDTEEIRKAPGEYVLYISDKVWPPLGDRKRSAINSVWTNYDKPALSAALVREYLETHPEKHPVAVYVTGTLTYTYQPDIDGMVIVDILNPEGLPVVQTETGYILWLNR